MPDLIYIEELSSDNGEVRLPYVKVGNKRLRVHIELYDSDEEFDEWFLESATSKVGLRPRTMWMHPLNMRRETDGEFVRLCVPLREYPEKFFKYYRMSIATHDYILEGIRKDITKYSNRPSIQPAERLAVTLRYLSTGMSFENIAQSFFMDRYTVAIIVEETCEKIYERFVGKHMKVPSVDDFKLIAADYEKLWQFPSCVGAIDGKHIRLKQPEGTGSMHWNYKGFYSIVLQAVADARYRFIFIDVGAYGKQSDGGIFAASSLSSFIDNENNFPPPPVVKGMEFCLPYLFVCDDAYPLKSNMMKPYSGAKLSKEEDIFNGRLSRARRCVECSFGILANKWRLLLKSIETRKEGKPEGIVKAACVLHNLIIDREGIDETMLKAVKEKFDKRESELAKIHTGRRYNHNSSSALAVRDCWKIYFNSPHGSVPWQDSIKLFITLSNSPITLFTICTNINKNEPITSIGNSLQNNRVIRYTTLTDTLMVPSDVSLQIAHRSSQQCSDP